MSSLLEHPTAQALLADAEVSAADVRGCRSRLRAFLQRYLPCFYRDEQRTLAEIVVQGKLSNLQRKTSEPIAALADRPRTPVQHFVGAGAWDDEAVQAELRRHVAAAWGTAEAVLVLDPSGFPKKGDASCGVQRQWCGRLGKVENCQVGVFVAYVTPHGAALVDRQLFLPREWARSRKRRNATYVPAQVRFRESWRIGLDLIERAQADLPFGWVTGDDEFGRVVAFRAELRRRGLRYVLDVPCDTLVRDIDEAAPPGKRVPPWRRVDAWAKAQPSSRWHKIQRGDGSKGPKVVRVAQAWVQTKAAGGRCGPLERLVVVRTVDGEARTWYALSNAPAREGLERLAGVQGQRHGVEEALEAAKGEIGLGHYEVRSWTGWHHHMTLSLLALWFLALEKQGLGKKNPGVDGAAVAGGVRASAAAGAAERAADCQGGQSGVAA
jgi:SRSO17 transposase